MLIQSLKKVLADTAELDGRVERKRANNPTAATNTTRAVNVRMRFMETSKSNVGGVVTRYRERWQILPMRVIIGPSQRVHKESIMKRVLMTATTLIVAALATPVSAAPVGAVISACDSMHAAGQTCNYGIKGNSLVGCTNTVVFECPADGSRQCTGTQNTSGKCNEDGTAARVMPLKGDSLLNELQLKKGD